MTHFIGVEGAISDRSAAQIKAVVAGLAPVIREYVAEETASLIVENKALAERIAELESRKPEIDLRHVEKVIETEVGKAVEKLPVPKDGEGIADLLIDREGSLIATFTDGRMKALGSVVGRDGDKGDRGERGGDGRDGADADMEALKARLEELVAAIPVPQDGKDGADGQDAYPGEVRGVFSGEETYRARDIVKFDGSSWIAKVDEPGLIPGDGWMQLASKGKRGDRGEKGDRGLEGKSGKDGAELVGLGFDADKVQFFGILDSGEQLEADFGPVAEKIVEALRQG